MTRCAIAALVALTVAQVGHADIAHRADLNIPRTSLAAAIGAIGAGTGDSIGIADATLASLPVGPLRGRYRTVEALRRLLQGSAADFLSDGDASFRITRRRQHPEGWRETGLSAVSVEDIVVTASKRATRLDDFPGSVSRLDTRVLKPTELAGGTEALVARQPALSSTHLGPGRDKIFIRGIADSSFNGPSQSTVGEYLGDVRLNYSAPDPDLALYDIVATEVLEGPQGTLYGAGALGGVMRFVPAKPDLARTSGWFSAGVSATAHGGVGHDAAASANIPLIGDDLGVRVVGYENVEPGYIDDRLRKVDDINRTETYGGRGTIRVEPSKAWTIDIGGVVQNISSRDGQYSEKGLPPLTRLSTIAQPFDNDYALADVVVHHDIGTLSLVSATSSVFHDIGSTFDASPDPSIPTRYVDDNSIFMVSNETRISRHTADGSGFVAGGEILHSRSRIRRTLGVIGREPAIAGTMNVVDEVSIYGEAQFGLTTRLFGTAGGRLAYDHLVGQVLNEPEEQPEIRRRQFSALPSIGVLWKISSQLKGYARYQKGYRPGGLSVQSGQTERFEADSVSAWELGLRYGSEAKKLSATAAASYARWNDIQSDLVDEAGLPYTTNVGSGRILAFEATANWRPDACTTVSASIAANHTSLKEKAASFLGERDATLPNIADFVARADVRHDLPSMRHPISLTASASYVGKSRLAVGPALDFRQGNYLDLGAGTSISFGRLSMSIDLANIADARRNIFAFGNPFGVRAGNQMTPLRPRTLRVELFMPF